MWLIPTRNRPTAMRDLIQAMEDAGEIPEAAVMIDGPMEPYHGVPWPASWHIHLASEHLEFQRSLNALYALHPNEKNYGVITDHARPLNAEWATELETLAGDWNVSLCNTRNLRARTGYYQMSAAVCIGGKLAHLLGYVWPDFCVHIYGDDAWEELINEGGLIRWGENSKVKDLSFALGHFPIDENHKRLWRGESYIKKDEQAFAHWRKSTKPGLLEKIAATVPDDCINKELLQKKITVCCVNAGNYLGRGSEYANKLYDMVMRNMPALVPFQFICFTDDRTGLDEGISVRPLPVEGLKGWDNKIALFKAGTFGPGERVMFLDLDTLIVSALDDIVAYDGPFATLSDFWRPSGLGPAVILWEAGLWDGIWDDYESEGRPLLARGDQEWLERYFKLKPPDILQELNPGKVVSYKTHCSPYPPPRSSIVCFHGEPRPHECTQKWVRDVWKIGGSGALDLTVAPNCNVDIVLANVKANENAAPWIATTPAHDDIALICGSGPSLLDSLELIRKYKGRIFALNNAAKVLFEHGIEVDYQVIIDARPDNVEFVKDQYARAYLMASQVSPDMFKALEGRNVYQWHPLIDGIDALFPDRDMSLVGGGMTVGLSCMALAYTMGFRNLSLFGYDSSYRGDMHHAAPQERTAKEAWTFDVTVNEQTFTSNAAMAKQAEIFPQFARQLAELDCTIRVYGDGLLPYIAHQMQQ